MRQAVRRSFVMVGGSLGSTMLALVRTKIIALVLGPAGLGWIALGNNLVEAIATVSGGGVSDALNRELARKRAEFSHLDLISTCAGIFLAVLAFALPIGLAIFLSVVELQSDIWIAVIALAIGVVAASAWRFLAGIYLGLGKAKSLAGAVIRGAALNAVLTALLLLFGVREPMVFVALSPLCILASGLFGIWRKVATSLVWTTVLQMPARRPVLLVAVPIVLGLLLEPLTALYIRSSVAAELGEMAVGLLQPGFQFVVLSATIFNSIMGITIVRWDQLKERPLSRNYLVLLGVAVFLPALGALVVFSLSGLWPILVRLLFSSSFVEGAAVVPWFLTAEALRMGGALLMFTFISRQVGQWTLLPRIACLITAVIMVRSAAELDLVLIAKIYASSYFAYFSTSLALWLALQVRLVWSAANVKS